MLLFYLFLSIGVSFLCSLFEAVILTISPAYVASVSEGDSKWGSALDRLKSNIDDSLAAILTLNTIAHTIGAAGVGAEILRLYGNEYVALGSVILTLLILFLSEIVPKTLGATYPRSFAPFATYGIRFFIVITYPFVVVCKVIARLAGASAHISKMTRDEVAYTAELGKEEGSLSEDEAIIIRNLLRLRKVCVEDVMTPRPVVFALDEDLKISEVLEQHETIRFSRIPIFHESIDHVTGFVMRYELALEMSKGHGDKLLRDISNPLFSVSEEMSIAKVFDLFLTRKEHLFSVHDEHGGLDGVISLEDVIETLLGIEITDEFDSVEDMRAYAKKKWEARVKARSEPSS